MPRVCMFTGKKTRMGAKRSHSCIQSKRKFKVNLLKKNIYIGGIKVPVKISAKAYKKMRGFTM